MKEKTRYRLYIGIAVIALALGLFFALGIKTEAYEAVKAEVGVTESAEGNLKYRKYYKNYYFDIEEASGLADTGQLMINLMANTLFSNMKLAANITVVLFYFCMDFDLTSLFGGQLTEIQQALKGSIFEPMLILGFAATAIVLLKKFLRRDLAGTLGQIAKVVFLVVLSVLIVEESATVLSKATGLTKSLSAQAISGINGSEQEMSSYTASCMGVLWMQLIHQPWLTLEFGTDEIKEEDVQFILERSLTSEERINYVKNYQGTAFKLDRAAERLGFLILYFVPFLIKCLIYILVSLMQLIFQFTALFYVLLAPVILIVSMFPGFEGMLSAWVRKIIESQIGVLFISFFTGLMIKLDSLLYSLSDELGWLPVMIIQIIVSVGTFLKRNEILGTFNKLQSAAAVPGQAKALMNKGVNVYDKVGAETDKAVHAAVHAAKHAGRYIINGVEETGHIIKNGDGKKKRQDGHSRIQSSEKQTAGGKKHAAVKHTVTEKTVERPVLVQQERGRSVKQTGGKPLEAAKRPRMDSPSPEGKKTVNEPNGEHRAQSVSAQGNPMETEHGQSQPQRPRYSVQTKESEKDNVQADKKLRKHTEGFISRSGRLSDTGDTAGTIYRV